MNVSIFKSPVFVDRSLQNSGREFITRNILLWPGRNVSFSIIVVSKNSVMIIWLTVNSVDSDCSGGLLW